MRMLAFTLAVLASVCAFATDATNDTAKSRSSKIRHATPEMREHMRRHTGGRIVKPGSQKGKVAFINTQGTVPAEVFKAAANLNAQMTGLNVVYEQTEAADPVALKQNSKADIAVIVVSDDKTPIMLAAVEDGWAVVNVKKLDRNLKSEEAKKKFYYERCLREVIRAFAVISGGVYSQYPGNIMSVTKVEDMDLCKPFIPMDRVETILRYLEAHNVTPQRIVPYRKACQEGWAPQPTNDYQKAVWEDVHNPPSKPLKVKFDPVSQKGKVSK